MPEVSLVRYDAACRAIAEAKSVDEVKELRDKAEAMRAYARQAKNRQGEIDFAEIRIRAERRLGELIKAQKETVGLSVGTRGSSIKGARVDEKPTLAEAGIDKNLADRARKMARVPEKEFETHVTNWRRELEVANERVTANLLRDGKPHVSHNSGENEWYTPAEYIEAAREVLGIIDLDPASSGEANKRVQAKTYYTADVDGLSKVWSGRVWMNPPYASELVAKFSSKLAEHVKESNVIEAIVLVNNATETAWFRALIDVASAVIFPASRIKFIDQHGNATGAPLQGQALIYIGSKAKLFAEKFSCFGWVAWL